MSCVSGFIILSTITIICVTIAMYIGVVEVLLELINLTTNLLKLESRSHEHERSQEVDIRTV